MNEMRDRVKTTLKRESERVSEDEKGLWGGVGWAVPEGVHVQR